MGVEALEMKQHPLLEELSRTCSADAILHRHARGGSAKTWNWKRTTWHGRQLAGRWILLHNDVFRAFSLHNDHDDWKR